MTTIKELMKARLTRTEGRKNKLYDDATGREPEVKGKITGGIGWNFTDRGIPDQVIELLFELAYAEAVKGANKIPVYAKLSLARKSVLIDMVFNMGLYKVLGFKNMLMQLNMGRYDLAAHEMLNSEWAGEVGNRALELAEIMRSGEVKGSPDLVE